jgi:hypothetical protein
VPEQGRSNRARKKSQAEGGERLQQRRGGIAFGEKQTGKHQGGGGSVYIEVEELDGRTD